jgi:hypothetical protein
LARAASVAVILAWAVTSAAAPAAVVPTGKEDLLADMLGRGAALPDGCTFASGSVDQAVVTGSYECPGGAVTVELRQVNSAEAAARQTDAFDLVVQRGSPTAALLDALESRIRAREAGFEWVVPRTGVRPAADEPLAAWIRFGQAFFALLIAAVGVAVWRMRQRIFRRDAAVPLGLTLLALVLRFAAHGGPADIRTVLGDLRPSRGGYVAFTSLVFGVLPGFDETIWTINRLLGACAVPLLYALLRTRFADPLAAVAGAAALAMTPLLVRFSASDAPYIALCAAFLGALVAYDRFLVTRSAGALALAAGLLTAAMQLRPEGAWLAVPAALVALGHPLPDWATLRRPAVIACVLAVAALNAVPTLIAVTDHAPGGYAQRFVLVGSAMGSPWIVASMTPRPLAALLIPGALAAFYWRRPGILWLAATLVADPIDFTAAAPHGHFANARYHIPAMYLACGLIGLGAAALVRLAVRALPRARVAATALAIAVVGLAAAPGLDLLQRMWAPQLEYEFFRDQLRHVDRRCTLVTLAHTPDAGFAPFGPLVPGRMLDITEFLNDPRGDCVIYYRCGNCYSSSLDASRNLPMHPTCRAMEEQFRLEPIAEAAIPALPYRGETYSRDPLPIGFFRVQVPPAGGR